MSSVKSTKKDEELEVTEQVNRYPCDVKNVYTATVYLESGPVAIDQIGKATQSEVSNLSPNYIEVV